MEAYIIRGIYVEPDKEPVEQYLDGSEAQMKELVDGNIASVGIDDGICCIHNALGEMLKLPLCRTIYNQKFYGSFVIVGFMEEGRLTSLDDDNAEYYLRMLALKK